MVRRYAGLAADEYGREDARPSLVLLHGLTFDRRMWDPVLEELDAVDPGRHVLAFDLPGHGRSAGAGCYRFESVTSIVARAIDAAGLRRPVIVGHSIAAVIASLYAVRKPTRGIVNVDQFFRVDRYARLARAHAGRVDDLVAGYWRDLLELTPAELAAWSRSRLRRLREQQTPYLVIAGGELDARYRSWLEAQLPQVRVTVFSEGGHFPHLVDPRRFAECVASFTHARARTAVSR